MANKQILLGLTTTPGSDWREKINELNTFKIKEIALFPTFLKKEERRELYALLEKTVLRNIPYAHLRSDMDLQEMNYLIKNYQTRIFNIHSEKEYPLVFDLSKFKRMIYVENTMLPEENEFERFGGLCIDFSHWHDEKLRGNKNYDERMHSFTDKYKIGCCHISAIKKSPIVDPVIKNCLIYASHKFDSLDEFDYMKEYKNYIPEIVSIELENSFEEQLRVKEYLEKIINS